MDIERGTPFANIDEARHTLDKMRAENFRTGLPNNLSFEDFHKASRIRNLLEENVVFAQTWQDTKANLEYVMRQVRKEFTGNILEEKIIEGYSKGRKEHVVLTDDNLGFRKQFYETLERLQEEESSKKKAA